MTVLYTVGAHKTETYKSCDMGLGPLQIRKKLNWAWFQAGQLQSARHVAVNGPTFEPCDPVQRGLLNHFPTND